MPWLEERTLTLFVRDTEVRRYEPGVRERGVDVERPSGPLMGSADTDTDPDRALPLKAPVIHGHLIRQHFFHVVYRHCRHLSTVSLSINGLSRAHYSLARTNWHTNRRNLDTMRSHGTLILVMIARSFESPARCACQIPKSAG